MKRAHTDTTDANRTNLNAQAGNHQDVRQDSANDKSQSTQQPIPTVSVSNDRPTSALPALLFPPQPELAGQFASGAPPGQLSASLPVLRGLEAAESAHESGNGQTDAPGSLALLEPGPTSCGQASMIRSGPFQEQGTDAGTVQAAMDKRYRSELIVWVESAAPTARAAHQEAQRRINAYLEKPAEQRNLIELSSLNLSTLPPFPADLTALEVGHNRLTALPEDLPQGLKVLIAEDNKLTVLTKHLPQGLQELYANENKLTTLPENLPQGLQVLAVSMNKLTVLPEHLPQALQRLDVSVNQLTALPKNLPQSLQVLAVYNNKLTALPEHLPQALRELDVSWNKLTALPKHMPPSLEFLSVLNTRLDAKTLVALMRINTSIIELVVTGLGIDANSKQILNAELVNNREHPARLANGAATLDLLTRLAFKTSDQTDRLIKRDPTPNPVAGGLPEQSIPAELHGVLAANCPKDVLAVLAGMVDGTAQ